MGFALPRDAGRRPALRTNVGGAAGWERRSSDRHSLRNRAAHGTTLTGAVALCSRFVTANSDTTSAGLRPAVPL